MPLSVFYIMLQVLLYWYKHCRRDAYYEWRDAIIGAMRLLRIVNVVALGIANGPAVDEFDAVWVEVQAPRSAASLVLKLLAHRVMVAWGCVAPWRVLPRLLRCILCSSRHNPWQ